MPSLASLLKAPQVDATAVLAAAEGADPTSQHARAIALLELDRFNEAFETFEKGGSSLQRAAPLAYAYSLYKTGRLQEARKVVEGVEDRGAKHLEAQVSYRSEDFLRASEIYEDLWTDRAAAKEESDLRINRTATDAQLHWSGRGELAKTQKPGREDLDSFETAYNAACGCLARGELGQAEVLLKRAGDLCCASDLSDDERATELMPIKVQQLFVLGAQGKVEEAERLSQELTVEEVQDLATRQIAQINNLALQRQPSNPYLVQRLFQSIPSVPPTDRLFEVQESLVRQNATALDLLMHKFTGVASSTARQLQKVSQPTADRSANSISATNAAATAQCQLGKLGVASILPLLEKRPLDVGLALTVVQLYVLTKNHGAAIAMMESLFKRLDENKTEEAQEVRFMPGVVAVLVSLYQHEGRTAHVKRELAHAATYWRRKGQTYSSLFKATGMTLLRSNRPEDLEDARELFAALREADSTDVSAAAGFVAAVATTHPEEAAAPAKQLTPIAKLTAGIDAAALESAGVPVLRTSATKTVGRKRPAAETAQPKKKRVRIARRPKDYDPNKKPDPERWLPLRDRSSYKPRGKKGKAKQQERTQGGISKETDSGTEAARSEVVAKPSGGAASRKKKGKKK